MINLLGAVALLLFGLSQVKDGASRALGARLRTGLATSTKSGGRSFLSGFVATVALQSATATAIMVSAFVERRLIKPRMAQIALLGANFGTAVTAWIVATGIEWVSPFCYCSGSYCTAATPRPVRVPARLWSAWSSCCPPCIYSALQTSSLHLDIPRNLKRINDHIVSVSHPSMDEQGLLDDSRLIPCEPTK